MLTTVLLFTCALAGATSSPQAPFPPGIADFLTTPRPPYIAVLSRNEVRDDSGQVISSYMSADGTSFEQVDVLKPSFDPNKPKVIVQQGTYSYISPDGTPVQVSYIADEKGFRPVGTHILNDVPAVPDVPLVEPLPVPAPPKIRARVKVPVPEPETSFPAPLPVPVSFPAPPPAPFPASFPPVPHPVPISFPAPPPVHHPVPAPLLAPPPAPLPTSFPAPVPVPENVPLVPVVPDSAVPRAHVPSLPDLSPLIQSLSTILGTPVDALFAQTPSGYVRL